MRSGRIFFFAFFGFLLVGLGLVRDVRVYDETLIPRLLPLLAMLFVALPLVPVVSRKVSSQLPDAALLRDPLVRCYAAYAAITAISLLFAVNVSAGFTDVFKTLATFLVLCISCLLLPLVPRWQEALAKIAIVAAIANGGISWWELLSQHGLGIHSRHTMETVMGLMTNVNLFAHFLNLALPFCLFGAVTLRGAWRWAAVAASIVAGGMLLLLQSRSAYVGLAGGATAAMLAAFAAGEKLGLSRRARAVIAGLFVAGVVGAMGFVATAGDDNPLAGRIRSIFETNATIDPGRPREGGRLMIWGITRQMIADHWLTGVGAGNFTVRLHEYFGGDDLDFSNVATNWIQPHNDFLWVFSEKGILGFAAFIGIFFFAFASLRTILRSQCTRQDAWLALFMLMGLVAYALCSCFDFPLERINHQVWLAVLLAAILVTKQGGAALVPAGDRLPAWSIPWRVALPPALVALGFGIVYALAALAQERHMVLARRAIRDEQWQAVVDHARLAATPWKTLDAFVTPIAFLEAMGQIRLGNLPEATACLERARRDNPNRMYVINNLGVLYAHAGRFDEAIECFELAVHRYPNRVDGFSNLANCYIETGRVAEAIAMLEQIPEAMRTDVIRANLAAARELLAAGK
jgi:O-antigen ligase